MNIERDQLIISPHCDDAFLALGGYILQNSENIKVVDIFATCAWTTNEDHFSADELTEVNRDEERTTASQANVELVLHDYPEALLRGYRKWNAKKIHTNDKTLSDEIYVTILKYAIGAKRIFLPLAPGHHVDHAIIHAHIPRLFDELTSKGVDLYVFEDLPYSWYGGVDEQIVKMSRKFRMIQSVIDVDDEFDKKLSLLKNYKSQLADSDIAKVTEYAQSLRGAGYSERIWQVTQK